jgi:leucyl aminopeptidase
MKFILKNNAEINKGVVAVNFIADGDSKLVMVDGIESIEIGVKKNIDFNLRKFILLSRQIIVKARAVKRIKLIVSIADLPKPDGVAEDELLSILVQNMVMANFEFNLYKSKPAEGFGEVTEVTLLFHSLKDEKSLQTAITKGQMIGEQVNACRVLSNTPGGIMTPTTLANSARLALKGTSATVKVLGVKEMTALKMGAILGVGKGSEHEPKFIIIEYFSGPKNEAPIVLAGKGVTFDTGGLNIKPSNGIYEMHMDMSGGAAVIHAIALAAKSKLKRNVVGLIPAVENSVSGSSYRPGDILTSMSGKTIEVLDTDAEGRIILADALEYAKKYKPRLVIDVATLTGSALGTLGEMASIICSKDSALTDLFQKLGEESGDYQWPLPLWEEYEEFTKGTFADVANISSSGNTRYAGAIMGGMFLYQFAKDFPWVHIDMAPVMTARAGEYLAKGATGAPTRFLFKLLEQF